MPADPDVQKRILRAEIRERRRNMTAYERERATEGFTSRLQEIVGSTGAESLSCFLSMPTEPNTRPFVDWAEARGIRLGFGCRGQRVRSALGRAVFGIVGRRVALVRPVGPVVGPGTGAPLLAAGTLLRPALLRPFAGVASHRTSRPAS